MQFIFFVETIVWSLIPFRQAGKKYFYFFYSIAFADPVTELLRIQFHSTSNFMFIPSYFLALISLQDRQYIKRYRIIITLMFIILVSVNLWGIKADSFILMSIINFLIFGTLIKDLMKQILNDKSISLFLAVLVFDELLMVLKDIGIFSDLSTGYFYTYILIYSDFIIGVFFLIIKADNPRLTLKLALKNP